MTPIADMVSMMLARDASRDDIVTAIEAAERHAENVMRHASRHVTDSDARAKSAARSKRYRASRKRDAGVTPSRDGAKPPLTLSSLLPQSQDLEKKENKKVRARRAQSVTLPSDWKPSAAHLEAGERIGHTRTSILAKADDMRFWAKANDVRKVDWDATFHGFLRRDAKRGHNGHGQQTSPVMAAFDRRIAATADSTEQGDFELRDITPRSVSSR